MTRGRVLLLASVIGAVVAAFVLWPHLQALSPEALADWVRAAGPLGPASLLALLVLQCIVAPLPSEPMMMAAGFVYGPTMGFTIAWLGVVFGAAACFVLAQTLGRPFAQRFVRAERLEALDAYVENRGLAATFAGILAIRLFAFTSFDVVSYGCGLVRFPFRWFLLATTLGAVPKALAFTYAGASAAVRPGWLDAVILTGTFGALLVVPWFARRSRLGRGQI